METTQLVLRREAQRARYRHAWWIAIAAGTGGNALLVLAMWASTPRAPAPNVSVMPAPATPAPAPIVLASPAAPPVIVIVPQAAPAPASFGDLGPCPTPHAARPTGSLRQPGDQEITHVVGAPSDSRWIAAWNDGDVLVSRDGGASWDEVLDAPGRVVDATFDCHGRVLVLRDDSGLGVRDGAREAWRAVPGIELRVRDADVDGFASRYAAKLVGGGRALAVIGPRRGGDDGDGEAWAAISDDGGLTWRLADLGWYDGDAAAAWRGETLRVVLPWTDCRSEGVRVVTVTPGGQTSEELGQWSQHVGLDRGTPYVLSEYCQSDTALCTSRQGRDWRPLAAAPVEARGEDGVVLQLVDGPTDVVIRNDVVQTLSGAHLGRARTLPDGFEALGTDLAGRVWGRDADGRLARR